MYRTRVKTVASSGKCQSVQNERRKRAKQQVQDMVDVISYPWKKDILGQMNKLERKIEQQDEKYERILEILKLQSMYIEE